ncbi:hypothetical protein B0H17DRAFT_1070240 [Mycena rosella]|uniref:Secreted protein n=1 Tax=Mycena rosella TaxID=1033263 RepID=A0AAD7GG86_MYCRO|nr:hypothetical protein B0H17DRAFT_1070240 [Mycena rosella]
MSAPLCLRARVLFCLRARYLFCLRARTYDCRVEHATPSGTRCIDIPHIVQRHQSSNLHLHQTPVFPWVPKKSNPSGFRQVSGVQLSVINVDNYSVQTAQPDGGCSVAWCRLI